MTQRKKWTDADIMYLKEKWGNVSLDSICKNLNRTANAVKLKAQRIGLPAFLQNGEFITFNALYRELTGHNASSYQMISWVENREFPLHYKKVEKQKFRIVYLDEFWDWAKNNQDFLDFSKMEENALGAEPAWVKVKRKKDTAKQVDIQNNNDPWTKNDDDRLKHYLSLQRYTLKEISVKLNRTNGAILKRIDALGIQDRPVPEDNHQKYTEEEKEKIKNMVQENASYHLLSITLGKSERALRGYLYRNYGTERLSQVKQQIDAMYV